MKEQNEHIYALNLNLEKILREENCVLLDSSFFSRKKNLPERIYMRKSYRQLSEEMLKTELGKLERNFDLLTNPKICVLEETVEELRRFQEIISTKASYLNSYKNYNKDHPRTMTEYREESTERKKDIFNNLCLFSLKIINETQGKIYHPKNPERYNSIVEIVKTITQAESLKGPKKVPRWYKIKAYRKELHENHTDEKIVAALLDSTFCKPIAAITKDYHLRLIFKEVCELIFSPELNPYNRQLAWFMRKNPASVYYYRIRTDENTSYFLKENLDPGWHLSRTRHFKSRANFKIISPYEETKKAMALEDEQETDKNYALARDMKARHDVITQLIRLGKADDSDMRTIIIKIMPENAKGNLLKY